MNVAKIAFMKDYKSIGLTLLHSSSVRLIASSFARPNEWVMGRPRPKEFRGLRLIG